MKSELQSILSTIKSAMTNMESGDPPLRAFAELTVAAQMTDDLIRNLPEERMTIQQAVDELAELMPDRSTMIRVVIARDSVGKYSLWCEWREPSNPDSWSNSLPSLEACIEDCNNKLAEIHVPDIK